MRRPPPPRVLWTSYLGGGRGLASDGSFPLRSDGRVNFDELVQGIKRHRSSVSATEVRNILKKVGHTGGDDHIEMPEFLPGWETLG